MDRKIMYFEGASSLEEYVAFQIECGIRNADVAGKAIPAEKIPYVIDGLLSKHKKNDLALACALSDYFYGRYNKAIDGKSRFISLQAKCAQEALDQHEPAVAVWQASLAGVILMFEESFGNKEVGKVRDEVILVLRNIFKAEGNHYGYTALETLRNLAPSPQDRTAKSDRRITGTGGSVPAYTQ